MVDNHGEQGRRRLKLAPGFKIGHPIIDQEHSDIIDELNRCMDIQGSGDAEACLECFHGFKDMLIEHFASEEKVMEGLQYPSLEKHAAQHATATDEIFKIIRKYKLDDEMNDVLDEDFISDIIELFLRHIAADDTEFKGYLQELKYQG